MVDASPSFEARIVALLRLAKEAHEKDHALGAQSFADERGFLGAAEVEQMRSGRDEVRALHAEVRRSIEELRAIHAAPWDAYLAEGCVRFDEIERSASRRFDAIMAKSLRDAWASMRAGNFDQLESTPAWALSAGEELRTRSPGRSGRE